ncbi:hypothetical protein HGT71_14640 [Rosenbergiella epipactidis]|uniref:hypothetical protein n=1 Tax=Rosenbergiella epipactidis TaxID=1544694 RepID=UPI001BD925EC|nr:hypothetical protein [Rosenbergiella epipactidis]MBT0719482.1 hypothetical protein [Rosenbergiella epipactidis]
MFVKLLRYCYSCFKNEQGGIILPFAIIIPILLVLIALAINSAKMFISKNKLADVAAEVGLIVSAANRAESSGNSSPALTALTKKYVKEFFPEVVEDPIINVVYSEKILSPEDNTLYQTFKPYIQLKVPYPYYSPSLSNKDKNFVVTTNNFTINKVVSRPVDIAFIVDFGSPEGTFVLRDVFAELTPFILQSNKESKIAILPFDTGVAVKYPYTNQRGGPQAGCSVLFAPTKPWDINYSFWGDKSMNKLRKKIKDQTYQMDQMRGIYYLLYVKNSSPSMSYNTFYNKWCRKNPTYGWGKGRVEYTCFDKRFFTTDANGKKIYTDDIFTPASLKLISEQYAKAIDVRDFHYKTQTIMHNSAIDYEATLDKMFGDEAIITIPVLWSQEKDVDFRPFYEMCKSIGGWKNRGQLNDARLYSWLIELTNKKTELDQFQKMSPRGGQTATASALIRSVPVMMEGRNPRKIFVIMSSHADSSYRKTVTDKFLKNHNLCQRIKDGFLAHPETRTERVDIYYISTKYDDVDRVNYWAQHCTGPENAVSSRDAQSIISTVKGIISDEVGTVTYQ